MTEEDAPLWRAGLALLIDLGLVAGVALECGDLVGGTWVLVAAAVVTPFLYGLFFMNGRALGGLVAGTRLVRFKDGARLGWWSGPAMFARTTGLVAALYFLNPASSSDMWRSVRVRRVGSAHG